MSGVAPIGLYLDEDVPLVLARLLHQYGFDALTTRDADNLGSGDEAQLSFATTRGLVMLTHNRNDFLLLHRTWQAIGHSHFSTQVMLASYWLLHRTWQAIGRSHAGIIAAHRHPPYEVLRRLLPLLHAVAAAESGNQFRFL